MKRIVLLFLGATFYSLQGQNLQWVAEANPISLQTNGVGYSADGSKVVSGTNCHPANVRLFDTGSGTLLWDYEVPSSLFCVMGVGISSNGKYLAAIEEFGNLLIFDYSTNPPDSITAINIGSPYAFSLAFSPDSKKLIVGGSGGKMIICDVVNGKVLNTINAHASWVTTVAYDPNGDFIVTGGNDSRINIWDTTRTLLHTLTGHIAYITKVVISADGKKIYSSSKDKTIKKWDVESGSLETSRVVSPDEVNALDVSANQHYIVTTSNDNLISLFNSADLSPINSFPNDTAGAGISIACSPVSNQIVVGTLLGRVVAYSLTPLVSVSEPFNQKTKIFPNPFVTSLRLEGLDDKASKLKIFDWTGREVHSFEISESAMGLDLRHLSAGTYLMTLYDEKERPLQSQKIIKAE